MREPSPEQLLILESMDFDKYVKVLFDEAHRGQVHLEILEGLNHVDPFVMSQAPMFWLFTIWAHAQVATMSATKLFDRTDDAFPLPNFFYMSKLRVEEFVPADKKEETLQAIEAGVLRYEKLEPEIKTLITLRNKMYAHISEELIRGTLKIPEIKVLISHIRSVLNESSLLLNSLTSLCRGALWASFSTSNSSDFTKVVDMLTDSLCREADRRDEEYKRYGGSFRSPRPRDCSKTKGETDGTSKVA
jgi:hypothetical protein